MIENSPSSADPFGLIADEFVDAFRQGKRPSVEEYVRRYPEHAEEIREVLPALVMMERAKSDEDERPAGVESSHSAAPLPIQQLGDFRIIREVGRGGMGVVYEAEQVSLGRHVALKVLSGHLLTSDKQRRRFEREARSAARLHHTNIVPVFGVGEQDGLLYYVMQFIQGLGLDKVLDEVRRLRGSDSNVVPRSGSLRVVRQDVSAAEVARSLVTGEFLRAAEAEPDSHRTAPPGDPTVVYPPGAETPAGSADTLARGRLSDTFSVSESSAILPGSAASGTGRAGRPHTYWHSVAQIGLQVAKALEYAHEQGILHRDIKPGNLLLDTQGTVWVTDFGLAKASDQQDLTHTGDILGTLRYMAPEAFEGRGDRRADVYALGLTLYELLALRPAFTETDRNRLFRQATTGEIDRLDALQPDVPRDLVTIVHKALERDPAHRYQTAGELAEDLQRFLDDEPIRARRVSAAERFVRWSRHNKGLAAALSGVAVLLVVSTIVSALATAYFWNQKKLQSQLATKHSILLATQTRAAEQEARRVALEQDRLRREAEHAQQVAAEQERLKNEALAAQESAEANYRQARQAYRQAREAVDRYLNEITTEPVLAGPGLQPLRKKLLQSSLVFYESFIAEHGDDPSLRRDLADALSRLGRITGEIGSPAEAAAHHQRAAALRRRVLADAPDDREQTVALAHDLEAEGRLRLRLDELPAAEAALESAAALWASETDDAVFLSGLARTMNLQGDAALRAGNAFHAMVYYNTALARQTQLAQRDPDHPEIASFRFQLARLMGRLAHLNVQMGQLGAMHSSVSKTKTPGQYFHEAEALLATLIRESPQHEQHVEFRRELALTLEHLGDHEAAQDGLEAAIAAYDRAAAIREQLARDNPLVSDYWAEWAGNLSGAAQLRVRQQDWPAAAELLEGAVERQRAALRSAPEAAQYRMTLAGELFDLGEVLEQCARRDAALAAYREAAELFGALPEADRAQRYTAAVCHARAARLSLPEAATPTAVQQAARDAQAAAALAALETAVQAGFIDVAALAAEPAFEPLKGEERFRQIVSELEAKVQRWTWHTDLDSARELAQRTGRDLLIYFSGSDWCVWCMVVRHSLLDREEFLEAASKDYVLVDLDTPQRKPKPPGYAETVRLKSRWNISSFPSFVFCDPQLRRFADFTSGRPRPRTVSGWIERMHEFHERRMTRDAALTRASDTQGSERDAILAEAFRDFPPEFLEDYDDPGVGLSLLNAAVGRAPNDPGARRARAQWFIDRQQWPRAAADLSRLFQLEPDDSINWIRAAAAAAHAEDWEGYRRICRELAARAVPSDKLEDAERAAKVLLMLPAESEFHGKGSELAETALTRVPSHWIVPYAQVQKALAHYRAGDNGGAIEWAQKVLDQRQPVWYRTLQAGLIKAMAHARLGQHDAAYRAWSAAQIVWEKTAPTYARGPLDGSWHDWLICELLRREAETSLAGNPRLAAERQAHELLDSSPGWTVLRPAEFTSEGGAQLARQADDSLLAGGTNPDHDAYTVTATIDLKRIAALRLEALPDPSLPRGGSGRDANGVFLLSRLSVSATPASGQAAAVPLHDAAGDYVYGSYSAADALDENPLGGWIVYQRQTEPHTAVFVSGFDLPQGDEPTRLTVRLEFRHLNRGANLGRFRLSVADDFRTVVGTLLSTSSGTLDPRARLAAAHYVRGEFDEAVEILNGLLADRPAAGAAEHLLLALALHALGRTESARGTVAQGIERIGANAPGDLTRILARHGLIEIAGLDPAAAETRLAGLIDEQALAALTAAIERGPDAAQGYVTRGDWHARRGNWPAAAADLSEALRVNPEMDWQAYRLGAILAYQDEPNAYRRHCQMALDRWGQPGQLTQPSRVAKLCLLRPEGIDDPERLAPMVAAAVANQQSGNYHWFLQTKALHDYRSGRFADAIAGSRASCERFPDLALLTVPNRALEAMAHHRLGRTDEALRVLALARRTLDERLPKLDDGNLGTAWHDVLIAHLLCREAEALIGGGGDPNEQPVEAPHPNTDDPRKEAHHARGTRV